MNKDDKRSLYKNNEKNELNMTKLLPERTNRWIILRSLYISFKNVFKYFLSPVVVRIINLSVLSDNNSLFFDLYISL